MKEDTVKEVSDYSDQTECYQVIAPVLLTAFIDQLTAYQQKIGKTRDLMHYILPHVDAFFALIGCPIYLSLYVNAIKPNETLCCKQCHQPMQGNGRSLKYIPRKISRPGKQPIYVLICILCPQQCCPNCRKAGRHYCHKIIPPQTVYYSHLLTQVLQHGVEGDENGAFPKSDAVIIRCGKTLADFVETLYPHPPDILKTAVRHLRESRGFEAVTTAVRGVVRAIWGSTPPKYWYSLLVNSAYLRRAKNA